MIKNLINHITGKGLFAEKIILISMLALFVVSCSDDTTNSTPTPTTIQFVYTSDAHFGITRASFQGAVNVDANIVHTALVTKINTISTLILPSDNGVQAGKTVGGIDYFINTGDYANREETGVQSATASWGQFNAAYLNGLTLKNSNSQKTGVLLLPGNHDVSNAIGYYKTMSPLTDNGAMVGVYNYMFPSNPKTTATYNYSTDKVHYSKDISGIHLVFVNIWPDSSERVWIENDLKSVSTSTPVILFTHDQPSVESKHLTNPNGTHDINKTDKFENLIPEMFKDGLTISDPSNIEQKGFATFLKAHSNIKAYFHGNDNENKYYDYKGPDNDVTLKTFQVDSPMKGNISGTDETKLSFQLITIDTQAKTMTVRECLWNSTPTNPNSSIVWGSSITISLQ
jgi:hypothetical protein